MSTANLDTRTARKVQRIIDNLMEGRIVIMITHSFDAIKKADQIIVLMNGEIESSGTHHAPIPGPM